MTERKPESALHSMHFIQQSCQHTQWSQWDYNIFKTIKHQSATWTDNYGQCGGVHCKHLPLSSLKPATHPNHRQTLPLGKYKYSGLSLLVGGVCVFADRWSDFAPSDRLLFPASSFPTLLLLLLVHVESAGDLSSTQTVPVWRRNSNPEVSQYSLCLALFLLLPRRRVGRSSIPPPGWLTNRPKQLVSLLHGYFLGFETLGITSPPLLLCSLVCGVVVILKWKQTLLSYSQDAAATE